MSQFSLDKLKSDRMRCIYIYNGEKHDARVLCTDLKSDVGLRIVFLKTLPVHNMGVEAIGFADINGRVRGGNCNDLMGNLVNLPKEYLVNLYRWTNDLGEKMEQTYIVDSPGDKAILQTRTVELIAQTTIKEGDMA